MDYRSILIIEDNKNLLQVYEQQLQQQGLLVHTALNAAEGLSVARNARPGTFLVDYKLPGMSGLDFCREIRNDPDLSAAIVIMNTGHQLADVVLDDFHDLADGWIHKADGLDSLVAIVMKWIEMVH